jgi:hypothetical protein
MLSVLNTKTPVTLTVIRYEILVYVQQPIVSPVANCMDNGLETSLVRPLNPTL